MEDNFQVLKEEKLTYSMFEEMVTGKSYMFETIVTGKSYLFEPIVTGKSYTVCLKQ